jgi:serine/threonine protein kinase/Tfp pilus assembly protein PilF
METTGNIHEDSMIGRRIGVYELKKEIGRGGMGAVYLATRADGEFHQTVAIKLVKRGMDTDSVLKRFRRERQILAALNHPNIAYFLGGGSTPDGLPYFVMEYIEGEPLYRFCDENNLSVRERLQIFRQICEAVEAAHEIKVIHRDLKPSNILVKESGKPKLLDFGIAKVLNPELSPAEIDPTATQLRILTPEYASPEQMCGEEVTPASDIYSLGIVLFELVTGHRPYYLKRNLPHETSRVICEEEPIRPSTLKIRPSSQINEPVSLKNQKSAALTDETIDGDLEKIILKTLRKNASERYQTAEQLAEDITNYLENRPVNAEYFAAPSKLSKNAVRNDNYSVAILPFKVIGARQEEETGDEFLGIGLADSLVSRISGVQRLIVRPTSSALPFADKDPFEAGNALGVDFVLDGNIRRVGKRIRVSAQLLSIAENSTRWARTFDEETSEVLELEDSISEQVAVALLPQLTGEERRRLEKRGTNRPEAYQAYLRGRFFWNKFTDEYLLKAVESFREAIALDPNYALPHVGIADFYTWNSIFGKMPSREAFPLAKAAAQRALEIDDSLGEAYAVMAFPTFLYDWNWDESLRLIRRSLELSPNFPFTHEYYSNFLCSQGQFEEGIFEIRRSEELDPLSPRAMLMTSWTLYQSRNFTEAVAKAQKANEMEKNFPQGLLHLGNCLMHVGKTEEAIEVLQECARIWQDSFMPYYMLCFALVDAGRREEARGILDEMKAYSEKTYVKPYFIAMAHAALGEKDEAFEWFEKAVEERNEWMIWFGTDPKLDVLRGDARYFEILKWTNNPIIHRQINQSFQLPTTGNREKSIAVLPFNFFGAKNEVQTDDAYLGIGLADALVMRLSNIRRFVVRPTSSVINYADNTDSFDAGKELGVEYVVEGNIRRFGDRIRVTTQLLDVSTNSTRWAEKFDENFTDVLEFEDAISERVAKSLITSLTGEELKQLKKRGTENAGAYEAYLRGRYYWNRFTPDSLPKALASFQKAIEIDPNYALAYVGLADFFNWAIIYGILPPTAYYAKAEIAARRAIELDKALGEAYASLALVKQGLWQYDESESLYQKAFELNPNYSLAHEWYSSLMMGTGKIEEGFEKIKYAESLDPLSTRAMTLTCWQAYQARRYEESVAKAMQIRDLDENYHQSFMQLGNALIHVGRVEEAVLNARKAAEMTPDSALPKYSLCFALVAAGRREEARRVVMEMNELAEKTYVKPYFIAMAYIALEEYDAAFEYFDKAFAERDPWINWFGSEPKLDALRGDPRFIKLFQSTGNPFAFVDGLNESKN